ncbi:MAG: hypothetical protein WCC60_03560 [Ilumatobacteraceae bacterium]
MIDHDDDAQGADNAVEYEIVGTPDVPVIWFDTHAVSELAEAVASDRDDQQRPLLRELHRRLVELRKANRIVVFETDQMYEVERVPSIARRCSEMLVQLSQGARSSYTTVQRRQREVGMVTRLASGSQAEIPWSTFWKNDPFADHSVDIFGGSVFVRVRFEPSKDELAARRRTGEKIAEAWEQLRTQGRADRRPQLQRLAEQVAAERSGHLDAINHLVRNAFRHIDSRESFAPEELDVQNAVVSIRTLTLDPEHQYQPTGAKRGGPSRPYGPYGPRKRKQSEP